MRIDEIEQGLFEMPEKIGNEDFGLDNEKMNADMATNFHNDNNTIKVGDINGLPLYHNEKENKYGILYKDKNKVKYGYYLKYEIKNVDILNVPAITQVAVWRKAGKRFTNIASDIFFDYLLPKVGCLVTDLYHTEQGHRFWLDRVSDAIERGLKVSYVNLIDNKITPIKTYSQLLSLEKEIWGTGVEYQKQRIVIQS